MEKKMYALTYCYEGTDNTAPCAITLAVSEDINKLQTEMQKCVDEDCKIDEDDEWTDDKNYIVNYKYETEVMLQHRKNVNLYAKYHIRMVDVL